MFFGYGSTMVNYGKTVWSTNSMVDHGLPWFTIWLNDMVEPYSKNHG